MCKHILNAQVSILAPCCKRWFDCPECHREQCPDHPLKKSYEMVFACKKCRKCFRKDMRDFDPETDEYCPHCDNHFVIAAVTPESRTRVVVQVEGDERMLSNRDPRIRRIEHDPHDHQGLDF